MPARFKLELDKLRSENAELSQRQASLSKDLASVTHSAEKFSLMLQKTKVPSETPRPDWSYIFETCVPHVLEHKIPG